MSVSEGVPIPEKRQIRRRANASWFWNTLTILILCGMLALITLFIFIFLYPSSPVNMFPPPTLPIALVLPSSTSIPPSLTASLTATKYRLPTITFTPSLIPILLTDTPTATISPTITITYTPEPTLTQKPNSIYPFMLQSLPVSMAASVITSNRGCDWMGVGGRVVDLQNRPATGITVQLVGTLDRRYIDQTSLTGTALAYGQSGFEFTLADHPISSRSALYVRLLDQAGLSLSEKVIFETFEDCQKNLVLINFKQVR
jgi:hypothetical protein